jgi:hypothetical protein
MDRDFTRNMKKGKRISTKKLSVRKHVESVEDFGERIGSLMKAGGKHIQRVTGERPCVVTHMDLAHRTNGSPA